MSDPDVNKRLRYFTGQFLQAQDFTDEQAYHVDRQRRHNRYFHTPGIAEGLDVTVDLGTSQATVAPGTALDSDGKQIVLLTSQAVPLNTVENRGKSVLVVISYDDMPSTDDVDIQQGDQQKSTRVIEKPRIEAYREEIAPPERTHIRLARFVLDADGKIPNVDGKDAVRVIAGVSIGDQLDIKQLRLVRDGVPSANWPVLSANAANQTNISGSLVVRGTVNGRNPATDGTNLDNHIANKANPHAVTAALVDAQGGANQLVTQINAGAGVITSKNIEAKGGWMRLTFLPKKYTPQAPPILPEFTMTLAHAISTDAGAAGNMEIPIPPGATRITRFRMIGTQNIKGITVSLHRVNVSAANPPVVNTTVLLRQPIAGNATATPFNVTFPIPSGTLDPELTSLALLVEAVGVSDIWIVAAEFA